MQLSFNYNSCAEHAFCLAGLIHILYILFMIISMELTLRCYIFTGVISTQGEVWHEQRRFIQSVFRELEMGHMSVEKRVQNEARYLTQGFHGHTVTPMDPHDVIQRASANVIYSCIFGNRMDYDDVDYIRIVQQVEELLENVGNVGLLSALPFLRFLPGDPIRWESRPPPLHSQIRKPMKSFMG